MLGEDYQSCWHGGEGGQGEKEAQDCFLKVAFDLSGEVVGLASDIYPTSSSPSYWLITEGSGASFPPRLVGA